MFYLISVQVICDRVWIFNVLLIKLNQFYHVYSFVVYTYVFTNLSISSMYMYYGIGETEQMAQWLYTIGHKD